MAAYGLNVAGTTVVHQCTMRQKKKKTQKSRKKSKAARPILMLMSQLKCELRTMTLNRVLQAQGI